MRRKCGRKQSENMVECVVGGKLVWNCRHRVKALPSFKRMLSREV